MVKHFIGNNEHHESKLKYKNGLWISARRRVYLYWFKFLQEAELTNEYKVDWKKYDGWGGANYILGVKFDEFWKEKWKDLFGVKSFQNNIIGSEVKIKKANASDIISKSMFNLSTLMVESKF